MELSRLRELVGSFKNLGPILVLGDIGVDKYTIGRVDRVSPEAPVPVLCVEEEHYKLGLAANVTHNLQTLGVASTLCGIVGQDVRANTLENLLEEIGQTTWGVVKDESFETILKERIATKEQQICRVDYERLKNSKSSRSGASGVSGALETLENLDKARHTLMIRIEDFISDHQALIIEDYSKGPFSAEYLQKIISLGVSKSIPVFVDPSRDTDPFAYRGANLIKPNFLEAKLIAKRLGLPAKCYEFDLSQSDFETRMEGLAQSLSRALEVSRVVITLGEKGMCFYEDQTERFSLIPTMASKVYDVSGAGDTVISLLSLCALSNATLAESIFIANLAGAVVVGKRGTATVSAAELEEMHSRFLPGR